MYPYTLIPSLLGGTYSSPVVNQGTNIMGGLAGGAAGIGSSMLLGGNPLTTGLLGIGGLLGGL